jgi:hypothetical protein
MIKRCFVSPFCENGDELEFLSRLPSSEYTYYGFNFTGSEERKKILETNGNIFISREPYQNLNCDYILVSNQNNNCKSFVSQTSNIHMEVYNLKKEKRVKKI